MPEISAAQWAQLRADFEAAEAASEAAHRACAAICECPEPQIQAVLQKLRRWREQCENDLLTAEAPTLEAAAYQLRLFALACHFVDPAEPPPDDEPDAAVLHRIYTGLSRLVTAPVSS